VRAPAIAIVSLACRYPDAPTPEQLWANVLDGRRSFRAMPRERLDLARYASNLIGASDSITPIKVGLLADWRFDRERFLIPQPTYEAADLTHWLALDVAAEAIERAGGVRSLDCARTAVVVGNTLTGEFSRASMLRLRWPFLDALLAEAAADAALDESQSAGLRERFATILRQRLPAPQEETLAGGLANTIAGRIANYFDLHGGAYSVDAACASSLVALANAADLLARDDIDAVIAGAVDLSLDPFELVGFSRNGALAHDDMRVFDARSAGFWPGEGAGFTVLMREADARRRGLRVRAVLRGHGISTDGAGGFTRPAVEGQVLALRRAYDAAGIDPRDVGYVEAHGTGTAVGDPVEVRALATLRGGVDNPLPIGSIKANVGHTKAAAGFAGLIKAVAALESGLVPPHVGCAVPHPVFRAVDGAVRPVLAPEPWPADAPRIAGVSGFGFGGINAHLVLEGDRPARSAVMLPATPREQDAELFVLGGATNEAVLSTVAALSARAPTLSVSELGDAARHLAQTVQNGPVRAAVVAGNVDELGQKLQLVAGALREGRELVDIEQGVCVARGTKAPRIGFLFPGQAAPSRRHGGLWARRFSGIEELLAPVPDAGNGDQIDTAIAQPAIIAASLAAWRILRDCGIDADVAAGHSLGELAALAWGGAIAERDLVPLAVRRGASMAAHGAPGGAMLRVAAPARQVEKELAAALGLTLACDNGPRETVLSGSRANVLRAEAQARQCGWETTLLPVSHAFHSPMMAGAAAPFDADLRNMDLRRPRRPVVSSVTGDVVGSGEEIRSLLVRQITEPVHFADALRRLSADLVIEVGPGVGLTRLARQAGLVVAPVDALADSLRPLLAAIGAAFVHGAAVRFDPLYRDRPLRAIDLDHRPQFLASPCGCRGDVPLVAAPRLASGDGGGATASDHVPETPAKDPLALVRELVAEETGFALDRIGEDDRFLDDLHLNSIAVARIVSKASGIIAGAASALPTEFANGSARELAAALTALRELGPTSDDASERVPGVRRWVRTFAVRWAEAGPVPQPGSPTRWSIAVIDGNEADQRLARSLAADSADVDGLLVWLGADADELSAYALLATCQSAARDRRITRVAICHAGAPVSAFARSVAIEGRFHSVGVIERPPRLDTTDEIARELNAAASGFSEVRLSGDGRRVEPQFVTIEPERQPRAVLGDRDVVLVTGGAKGIGAECALRLAARSGAALVLAGRAAPDDDAVAATLGRAKAAGIRCRYVTADVAKDGELAAALSRLAPEIGPITAMVHAAGVNDPIPFESITPAQLAATLGPKTAGLRAAIAAAGPHLRRIVTFGSIIGRIGLKGEAHYALANAWQSAIAEQVARERADCDVLSLEWSIWNGAGMGHRLGSLERLARFGVDAIALDEGIDMFERLVLGGATGTMMVTSRFGPPAYVSLGRAELPLRRFLDTVLLHYPRLELVVETALSRGRDPYLADHQIGTMLVMPAVFSLEAMAEVAGALKPGTTVVAIEAVAFSQVIVVPESGAVRVRIMALAGEGGRVEAVIRAEDDDYAVDRMRATFLFASAVAQAAVARVAAPNAAVDAAPLYGPLFFQAGHFQRVRAYSALSARHVAAALAPAEAVLWFAQFEPQALVLPDPGARDALLHALQAAVPHRRVVPVSAERISLHPGGPIARIEATERNAGRDTFVFDIVGRDKDGAVVEEWQGAVFRAISEIDVGAALQTVPELAGPYIERVARAETEDHSIAVSLVADPVSTREQRRACALAALGVDGQVFARNDGQPVVLGPPSHLSIAHCNGVTLAVKADRRVGCDIELAPVEGELTAPPLPPFAQTAARELADSGFEPWATALSRLWTATEVALKRDQTANQPCQTRRGKPGEIITFESTAGVTATVRVPIRSHEFMVAIGTSSEIWRCPNPAVAEAGVAPAGGET
jgi:enediyne polyketide synthase